MGNLELRKKVRKFISENFILADANPLNDDDSLLEKGIIDSTGVLELVAFIEENYHLAVEDEEMIPENLDSVKNIVSFIQRKAIMFEEAEIRELPL
jgi:acyl carrier protein